MAMAGDRTEASSVMIFGGVPEHFNLAVWQYLNSPSPEHGVRTKFVAVPGGTGAMVAALSSGSVDVAIALTEGIVAAAAKTEGPEQAIQIVAPYVDSPLAWGIATGSHQAAKMPSLSAVGELAEIRVGVSRMGSGSHLMSFLLAEQQGWDVRKLKFVICKDISGLRKAVSMDPEREGHAHLFLWETGMIDPFVLAGELDRLGVIPTPWPCFVMAARRTWLDDGVGGVSNRKRLGAVLPGMRGAISAFVDDPAGALETIAARFMVRRAAAATWLREVRFAGSSCVQSVVLRDVVAALHRLDIITGEQAELVEPHLLVDEELVSLTEIPSASASASMAGSPGSVIRADASRLDELLASSPLKPSARGRAPSEADSAMSLFDSGAAALERSRSAEADTLTELAAHAEAAGAAEMSSGGAAEDVEAAESARLRVLEAMSKYLTSIGASGVEGMH
jgi:hypothetical protein